MMDPEFSMDRNSEETPESKDHIKQRIVREPGSSERPALRFPAKLWTAVNDPSSTLLTWDHEGAAFLVHEHRFREEVMTTFPGLVHSPAFNNFRRQLREYQFDWKVNHVTQQFQFQHDSFRQGHPELIGAIQTRRRARTGAAKFGRPSGSPLDTKDVGWGNRKRTFPLDPAPSNVYSHKLIHPSTHALTQGTLTQPGLLVTTDQFNMPSVLPYTSLGSMSTMVSASQPKHEPVSSGMPCSYGACQCQECLRQGALRFTPTQAAHMALPRGGDYSSELLANLVRAAQLPRMDINQVVSMLSPQMHEPQSHQGLSIGGSVQTTAGYVMTSSEWQEAMHGGTGTGSSQGSSQNSL